MKVLIIHNFHRKGSASGDDQVFKNETRLLEKSGMEVVRYTTNNDLFDNANFIKKILYTFGMLWSGKHYRGVRDLIQKEKPDLVHIHTFFPLLSPSVLYAAKIEKCKVVATLHDTRFICPCATSLCNGKLCNQCGDGKYFRMCKYKCFKNSRIQSLIVAFIFKYHRMKKTFYRQIDKYICLNDQQMTLLTNIGFEPEKIVKKYNFVEEPKVSIVDNALKNLPQRYVVFYGRIGEEKGIRILQEIWEGLPDIPLVVMGAGPLEEEFAAWSKGKKNIYFLGYTEHEKCLSIVKKSEFVIFPSIWYEGCSMVEIEAESLGKGLIVTDLGFSSEAIVQGVNGYKLPLGDVSGFRKCIRKMWSDPELCTEIGSNARKDYEQKYTYDKNIKQLIGIYQEMIG